MKKTVGILTKLDIDIPNNLIQYSLLKKRFSVISKKKADYFNNQFYKLFTNMDNLASNGFQKGFEIIKSVIEVAVEELVKKGLYDINIEYFTDKYVINYFQWENDFQVILDKYTDICLDEDEARQYRKDRKNNRSKWGVLATNGNYSDAIDAKMTTGLWNITEGIGHSIFNAIGNAASEATSKAEKKKLFNNSKTRTFLTKSIFETCFNIHYALIDALNDNSEDKIITKKELIESEGLVNRLLENLEKNRIPSSEIENVIKKVIVTFPFRLDFFKYLLNLEKFNVKEIIELANYFSLDISNLLFDESIIKMKSNMSSYDLQKRSDILANIDRIGVTGTEFDKELNSLKQACLEYHNTKFKTFNQLEKAMQIDNSVFEMKDKIPDYDLKKRSNILSKIDKVGITETTFDKELESLKQACLKYHDIQFKTFNQLEKIMREDDAKLSKLVSIFSDFKSNEGIYIEDVPMKKKLNAVLSYNIPANERILVLIDDTVMGSAKEGIAFCTQGFYLKNNSGSDYLKYENFINIKRIKKSVFGVTVLLSNGRKIDMDLSGSSFSKSKLLRAMNSIRNLYSEKNLLSEPTQAKRKKDTRKRYMYIWLIYIITIIVAVMLPEENFILGNIILSILFSFVVAKEKGRNIIIWSILGITGVTPLILTILKHTPERISELES